MPSDKSNSGSRSGISSGGVSTSAPEFDAEMSSSWTLLCGKPASPSCPATAESDSVAVSSGSGPEEYAEGSGSRSNSVNAVSSSSPDDDENRRSTAEALNGM